tara:strand:+ start:397 stop:669 length:273 start_codon:yes stop_codon:yes gene_type:complete
MARQARIYDFYAAICEHDLNLIRTEQSGKKRIRNKNRLSILIETETNDFGDRRAIYQKILDREKGFLSENDNFISFTEKLTGVKIPFKTV